MQLKDYKWIVLLVVLGHITSTTGAQLQMNSDYFYQGPEMEDAYSPNSEMQPETIKYVLSGIPNSENSLADASPVAASAAPAAPATPGGLAPPNTPDNCDPAPPVAPAVPAPAPAPAAPPPAEPIATDSTDAEQESKTKELRNLVQHVYIAQARVQLEATEIKKAEAVAKAAQEQLEQAANHVRTITAALQNAQQEVAAAAIRAQTAQLQLAAHDQLLFAARQDVDALSSQMVGLQAAEGISQPKITFDLSALLEKLRQPLPEEQKPTAVPPVIPPPTFNNAGKDSKKPRRAVGDDFYE